MRHEFSVPDELAMTAFFCAEPVERSADDGYWCYNIDDDRGFQLRFSYNIFEQSVQAVLMLGGELIATLSHEGAHSMRVENDALVCRFHYASASAILSVSIKRGIRVELASLRTE